MAFRRWILLCATLVAIAWGGWVARDRGSPHAATTSDRAAARDATSTGSKAPSPTLPAPVADEKAAASDSPARRTARFRQAHLCYSAWNQVETWGREQDNCRSILAYGADATTEASCQAGLDQARPQMQASRGRLASCPDAGTVARRYYEAARDAALAGDADAQACYVLDFFDNPDRSPLVLSAKDIADYRRDAPRYLSDGLARGDWRTVGLLAMHYIDGSTLLPLVASQKPVDQYVMERLLQLGADRRYAHELESVIQVSFLSPGFDGTPLVTPAQAAEGDARARALYHRYFEASPRLQAEPIPCPSN
jgi:hypothetical protein